MQQLSQPNQKSSSLLASSRSFLWWCPWIPANYDTRSTHELQAGYQKQMIRLMVAQATVLYGSSAIYFLPDDCQASFSFVPTSRALSLAGVLTQLAFYYGIPLHLSEATSFLRAENTRPRAMMFFVSLWIPFLPFVLSIILLFFAAEGVFPSYDELQPEGTQPSYQGSSSQTP